MWYGPPDQFLDSEIGAAVGRAVAISGRRITDWLERLACDAGDGPEAGRRPAGLAASQAASAIVDNRACSYQRSLFTPKISIHNSRENSATPATTAIAGKIEVANGGTR